MSTIKYSLSIAAALILAPSMMAAPNEQTQTHSQQGTVTQNNAEQGSQSGTATQSGITTLLTPPNPENPTQEVEHTVAKGGEKGGIVWGDFLLYPEIAATLMYDDNIYASRKNERPDSILTTSPEIRAKSNFSRHYMELGTGVDLNRYHSYTNENTNDSWVYGKGRIDITNETNVYGGVSLARDHEDRSSPDANQISSSTALASPTRYTDLSANVGVSHKLTDRLSVRLGASSTELNYEDTPLVGGGTYSSDYRDRQETLAGGRLTFSASDTTNLFVQAMNDHRKYDTNSLAYNHNSHGFNAAVGMSFKPYGYLNGEVYLGKIYQKYDDPQFDTVDATDYGLNVKYRATPWTDYALNLERSLEETTINNSSGYINTALTGRVNHSLSRDLSLNASLTRQWSKYNDIDRTDIYTGAGVGVKYYLSNSVYTAANYQYRHRDSTAIAPTGGNFDGSTNYADYDNNLVYVTVGTDFGTRALQLVPTFVYPNWSLFASPFSNTLTGWYAGATIGVNSLNAWTKGLRDPWTANPNNTDSGQFGEMGIQSGLFAGYGQMLDEHFYFGIEAELERSNTEISHDHVGDTHFTIGQDSGFALTVRPGYMMDNGSLFYGRLGWASTRFSNYINVKDEATIPPTSTPGAYYTVDEDKTRDGFRLGLGTDVPVNDNVFMRMDYAYTKYSSYSIPVYNADGTILRDDAVDNSGGTFKLGIGWNFGGSDAPSKVVSVDPKYLDGLYVGAMIGHGPINTAVDKIHNYGGATQSHMMADFGRDGFTGGAFLGYGMTFGQWYAGFELEAEAATFGWHHDRQTSGSGGRDYYAHKKGGFGQSVRLGYALKNGSLIYARAGRVDTKFNTIYMRGPNDWVDQDNTIMGSRLGLGTEIPFNKSLFMRMDYIYTDYDAYTFMTAHDDPDVVTYDNDESMFRFGLGFRF